MLITFEGIDNSGKTTAAKKLVETLNESGRKAIFTREPGGTEFGEWLRDIVFKNDELELDTKAFIINALRIEHVRKVIVPAVQAGTIVVCDRFIDSTYAYQVAQGWDKGFIYALNAFTTGGLYPDLVLWLDVPLKISLAREDSGIPFASDKDYLLEVIKNYKWLNQANPERFKRIDATLSKSEVNELIKLVVMEKIRG